MKPALTYPTNLLLLKNELLPNQLRKKAIFKGIKTVNITVFRKFRWLEDLDEFLVIESDIFAENFTCPFSTFQTFHIQTIV